MPVWLENGIATFQRRVQVVPDYIYWKSTLVAPNNIPVFSMLPYDLIEQIRRVLRQLYKSGVAHKQESGNIIRKRLITEVMRFGLIAWNLWNTL